jgi:hypothetical protein
MEEGTTKKSKKSFKFTKTPNLRKPKPGSVRNPKWLLYTQNPVFFTNQLPQKPIKRMM